jgi:sterol 24-C-methyltransferase
MHEGTTTNGQKAPAKAEPRARLDEYSANFDAEGAALEERYATISRQFYDLVTDFYEFGWGKSFHFAVRRRGESFADSLARHETFLADKLGLRPGMRAVDLGCGVGGPMRNIARSTGAHVTGVNINDYQVSKVEKYNREQGLTHLCDVIHADFLHIPVADGTFDAAYGIEATCHAPTRESVYGEAARVIKPGGCFAVYEWCMTAGYDDGNPEHRRLKRAIERGNGIASLASFSEVEAAMRNVGFDVVEARNRAEDSDPTLPWYSGLSERSLRNLPRTPAGRALTNLVTGALEKIGVAPRGTQAVSSFLNEGADDLVAAGELGIFTPMYFVLARKRA